MDGMKFLEVVEEVFELDPGEVNSQTPLDQVPGWGSLTVMGLIARVDEEFGVTLSPSLFASCKNLADLQSHVVQNGSLRRSA